MINLLDDIRNSSGQLIPPQLIREAHPRVKLIFYSVTSLQQMPTTAATPIYPSYSVRVASNRIVIASHRPQDNYSSHIPLKADWIESLKQGKSTTRLLLYWLGSVNRCNKYARLATVSAAKFLAYNCIGYACKPSIQCYKLMLRPPSTAII
jgi:hypothetical protein